MTTRRLLDGESEREREDLVVVGCLLFVWRAACGVWCVLGAEIVQSNLV